MSARLFAAVVPPPEALADLEQFAEPRQDRLDPLRWSDPRRWHLTLAFMPRAPVDRHEQLIELLQTAVGRHQPFDLSLGGAGAFPDPAYARVLWVGAEGGTGALARLAAGARTAASRSGVAVEGGAFHPHLTLARANPPLDVTRWLRVFDTYAGPTWTVSEVELVESLLGAGSRRKGSHAEHQVLEVIPLGAGPDR